MPRTFDPASLVAVPQLSATGATTLGTELKTAATGQSSTSYGKA